MLDVICIVGPTAVGKTRMGVKLAKKLGGEVISGDSMQIYRGMDIGTAKATLEEREGIIHHLLDEKNPDEDYSVAEFQKTVRAKIADIKSRNKVPIIVGGTGLYIKAVLYDYEFTAEGAGSSREDEKRFDCLSNDQLHAKLAEIDVKAAADIHPNNRKRIIRALEIFETSGEKKSEMIEQQKHELFYGAAIIGLTDARPVLYDRINKRVDAMVQNGLLEEVRALMGTGIAETSQAMRAIGYKELYPYFRHEMELEQAVELIKRNSRRYAKRQFTWFNNQMKVDWFNVDVENFDKTVEEVLEFLSR